MRQSLLWKLLGVNVLIIAFVISVVWLAINYLPLTKMTGTAQRIAEGDYTGEVLVVSRDEVGRLSEAFNRMSASLRHTEQLRKKMVIDVAHELRTPLTNIRGYLEALADNVLTPSRETLLLLQEETLRLTNLVDDIMRLARADAARADLHRVEIEANSAITQLLESFRPQLDAKGIDVEVDPKQRDIRLSADPEKLSQVVANMLQNACRYTPPGGALKISIERTSDGVLFIFANTRGELEDKELPFIFERFYRGEKSRSREHGGAGIGLAIVKELIEAHGGHVGAELSQGYVRIWFSLPVVRR